jgi:hypothetical protein
MKKRKGDIGSSAQESTDIPGNATGVLRLVDSQKNSHSDLLGRAGQTKQMLIS